MADFLTTKELTIISDLLVYEEQAIKKARLYSKTLTDPAVTERFSKLIKNHERRFLSLYKML